MTRSICHSEAVPRRDTPEESVTDASEGIPECFFQHDMFIRFFGGFPLRAFFRMTAFFVADKISS